MITGKGIGFLVTAVALLLLGRLTQVGWLYLVDAVLWGIIALSAIFPWLGVAFITAQRRIEAPNSNPVAHGPGSSVAQAASSAARDSVAPSGSPTEGDPVRITLTLDSRAFWPSYRLNVYYECNVAPPDNRLHRFFVSNVFLSGQSSGQASGKASGQTSGMLSGPQTMESTVDAYQRGLHHLGPVVIESTAPFGLFRRRRKLTGTEPVLVYPQVQPMRRLAMAQGFSGMESQGKKRERVPTRWVPAPMLPGTHAGISIGATRRKSASLWSRNWKTPWTGPSFCSSTRPGFGVLAGKLPLNTQSSLSLVWRISPREAICRCGCWVED